MSQRLIHILAPARISRYRSFLKLTSHEQVYRAYCWNYAISAAVFPILGCVEMHLRDAVHKVLTAKYGPAGAVNPTAHPWYDWTQLSHYPLQSKSYDDVYNLLYVKKTGARRVPQPTTDDVVASLTFGFWTNLLRTFTPVQAPRIIPAVFPNHHVITPGQWGNTTVREALNKHLRVANDFRNRVAHHEPLFKFRYNHAYPTNLKTGLENLRACMKDCLIVSKWTDLAAEASLEQSIWFKQFQELATLDGFYSWVLTGVPKQLETLDLRCARFATSSMLGAPG